MPARLKIVLTYAAFAALWIFGSDRLLAHIVQDRNLLSWIGTVKGLAFVATTSFLLYLLLRIWPATPDGHVHAAKPTRIRELVALFVFLSLIAPIFGYSVFKLYVPELRTRAFADLTAIAALKAEQIESWLRQRELDAKVLAQDQDLADLASALTKDDGNKTARTRILRRLNTIRQIYGYESTLMDETGKVLLSSMEAPVVSESITGELLQRTLRTDQVQQGELYRNNLDKVDIDYVVPLARTESNSRNILILHAPIEQFLFPLIQRWPTPSPSAETMLVRRDKETVLYLNTLKYKPDGASLLRTPIKNSARPAVIAVVAGEPRQMETRDRRGIEVLAASRPVKGTTWYVVAKIDKDEVLAPLKFLAFWIGLIVLAAMAAIAGAIFLLWRQLQRSYELALLARGAEQDRLLKLFFDLPFVGMAIICPVSKRWLQVNDCLCDMFGFSRDELLELTWEEVSDPKGRDAQILQFTRMLEGESDNYQGKAHFLSKRGTLIETGLDLRVVRRADKSVELFVATIQDTTARSQATALQKTLSDRISVMMESMIDGFVALDRHWRYLYVNRHAAELFGREASELIGKHIWTEFPEGVGQPFFHAYQRVMTTQVPEQIEDYYAPWDRWFENRIYPTPDGISIYFQDITARKQMEAKMHQQLAELLRWQEAMLGREDRVRDLKHEINTLLIQSGQAPRYLQTEL